MRRSVLISGALVLGLGGASAGLAADPAVVWSGDVRFGYANDRTDDRSNERTRSDDGRARVRVAATLTEGDWTFRGRVAGRYSTDVSARSPYLRFDAPSRSGARFGDTTLDQFYAQRSGDGWSVTVGRFQSAFVLPGVAAKALDRNDSTSFNVNWTDGIHLQSEVLPGWTGHAVVQYHDSDGSGQVHLAPLDYSNSGSRVGMFLGLSGEATERFVTRMLGVTWYPSSLASEGMDENARDDYWALDGKLAAQWPLGDSGTRLMAGGELGYAPNRPDGSVMDTGQDGSVDGLAWQASLNLYDMMPGHSIGVVYGRVGAGWLLSPNFRPNDEFTEVRYRWDLHSSWFMEARYRIREELKTPDSAMQARRSNDFYIRFTGRF